MRVDRFPQERITIDYILHLASLDNTTQLPTMRPRDRLIDLFSTFARLEDDRFRQWIGDPRLQRSMERQLTNAIPASSADERLWGVYWHQQHTNHPLAQSHLTAYLQEPCFWVAQEMSRRLQTSQYTLADYFQLTNIEVPRVLKSFSPERSSNLKTYAKMVLTNALKDLLRQRQAADVCSLNRSKPDAGSGEMQDDLTDPASESLLDTAIEQEEIERRTSQQI